MRDKLSAAQAAERISSPTVRVELVEKTEQDSGGFVVITGPGWTIYADSPSVYIDGEQIWG